MRSGIMTREIEHEDVADNLFRRQQLVVNRCSDQGRDEVALGFRGILLLGAFFEHIDHVLFELVCCFAKASKRWDEGQFKQYMVDMFEESPQKEHCKDIATAQHLRGHSLLSASLEVERLAKLGINKNI